MKIDIDMLRAIVSEECLRESSTFDSPECDICDGEGTYPDENTECDSCSGTGVLYGNALPVLGDVFDREFDVADVSQMQYDFDDRRQLVKVRYFSERASIKRIDAEARDVSPFEIAEFLRMNGAVPLRKI